MVGSGFSFELYDVSKIICYENSNYKIMCIILHRDAYFLAHSITTHFLRFAALKIHPATAARVVPNKRFPLYPYVAFDGKNGTFDSRHLYSILGLQSGSG